MTTITQPTDSQMLDWMIENADWCGDIFYVVHIEGKLESEYPTRRELIASEMAKKVK